VAVVSGRRSDPRQVIEYAWEGQSLGPRGPVQVIRCDVWDGTKTRLLATGRGSSQELALEMAHTRGDLESPWTELRRRMEAGEPAWVKPAGQGAWDASPLVKDVKALSARAPSQDPKTHHPDQRWVLLKLWPVMDEWFKARLAPKS
jgi:hypothetical protein